MIIVGLKLEDDLNFLANGRRPQFLENGRRPQFFGKWKTTSTFWKMEDDLNVLGNMEDDFNFINKWKTTSI